MSWRDLANLILRLSEENETHSPIRIVPLLMHGELQEFLNRRRGCFTKANIERLDSSTWRINSMKEIPSTATRASREIESTFLLYRHSDDLVAIISRADRDTYHHGAKLLELSSYPFALRPYLPVRTALSHIERFAQQDILSLRVIQFRASGPGLKRKMQIHGSMTIPEVDTTLRTNECTLEGIRVKTFEPIGGDMTRLRVDDRCRLLIELWQQQQSPLELVASLIQEFKEKLNKTAVLGENQSDNCSVIIFKTEAHNIAWLLDALQSRFSTLRGTLLFPLDPASRAFKVIDFVTGVDCMVEPFSENSIAATFGPFTNDSFIFRVKSMITQIIYSHLLR